MQTLALNMWGKTYQISFHLANYANNNNLYIGLILHGEDGLEPWSDLTVNLDSILPPDRAYVDHNNNGKEIMEWLIDNELAFPTFATKISGFCEYLEFVFNMPELMKYVTLDERK